MSPQAIERMPVTAAIADEARGAWAQAEAPSGLPLRVMDGCNLA